MKTAAEVIEKIANNASNAGFGVRRSLTLPGCGRVDLAASRTRFSWKGILFFSEHILVQHIQHASAPDAGALFQAAFQYGKRRNRIPLPRGFQFGYVIIPVIISEDPNSALVQLVAQSPPRHWALFEFPVVVDLSGSGITYFTGTQNWGRLYLSDIRLLVRGMVERAIARPQDAPGL
ncbi:MAG: hypothetical protein KGM47_13215 [Acidobacteriota bacterium]|nr:hypothetical protein [Acidobacteriota bacterium]